jgi:hypothetical protein
MAFFRPMKTVAALALVFLLGSCGGGHDSV